MDIPVYVHIIFSNESYILLKKWYINDDGNKTLFLVQFDNDGGERNKALCFLEINSSHHGGQRRNCRWQIEIQIPISNSKLELV